LVWNLKFFSLSKVDDVQDGNSVLPGDEITYTIYYANPDPNNLLTDVNIVDYLPDEVNYVSSEPSGDYEEVFHTVTWPWQMPGNDLNSVTLIVKVNERAEPLGTITNTCGIEANEIWLTSAAEITDVNSWKPDIIYVDSSSSSPWPNTGMSWKKAYRDLQDALEKAGAGYGSQIWVAAGIYKPTNPANYWATFELINGVALYGGFAGTEAGLSQRNWLTNETTLSGDIDNDGQMEGNASYVVTASDVNETAIIDGFTITMGYYAGILVDGGSPIIQHNKITNKDYGIQCISQSSPNITECQILDNTDAGICCTNSDPNISHCSIKNNAYYGIYGDSLSIPVIKNNWICGNGQSILGPGIYLSSDSPSIVVRNNTIANNAGYGIYMYSDACITNCIVWGSGYSSLYRGDNNVTYSCIQGGYDGVGNISYDPCFVDAGANNYHLSPDSNCIDVGDPCFVPDLNETDIDGEPRIFDGDANDTDIVDMGADEFYWSPADFDRNEIVNFLDYAVLASVWLTDDPNISLDDDNDVDIDDLALFCDDWLWEPAWKQSDPLGMMGSGCGRGAGFTELLYTAAPPQQPQIELQSELQSESAPQPEPALESQPQLTEEDIQELVDWLEELWLTDEEVRSASTEADWLELIETIRQTPVE
jgi:uncharacterized repeat protein (TIGR01451 family)